jgi:hypothetical protein
MQNTPNMTAGLTAYFSDTSGTVVPTGSVICPAGFGYGDSNDSRKSRTNGRCILVSLPKLANDMFWQNRAFHVEMVDQNGVPLANQGSSNPNGGLLGANYSQQNIIALLPEFTQSATGQCLDPTGLKNSDGSALQLYWDVGVRMDTLPNVNGHALVFDSSTVSTSYNLEGAAIVTAAFQVAGVSVSAGGNGYVVGDVVNFAAAPSATGSGAVAAVSAVDANGAITAITVTASGSLYSLPPIVSVTSANGTGALLNATLNAGSLTSIKITDVGGAYTRTPTLTIDAPPAGGTQATATVTMANGRLTSIALVNNGSGYTTVPNVVFSGGGIQPNTVDNGAVGLTATNSIFSDAVNAANVFGANNVVPTAPAGGAGLLVGQYCNGARVPPEQCTAQQGANNQGMCLGYFTPAGISENVGVPQVFRFKSIAATATVDEGNNWINMTYGPLTLSRPTAAVTSTPTAQEQMVTVAPVGATQGAYSIPATSVAVNNGTNDGAPKLDFYGNTRPLTAANPADIGAVEYQVPAIAIASVTGGPLAFGNVPVTTTSASRTLTLHNTGAATLTSIAVAVTAPYASTGGTCGATLGAGSTCTISVAFSPTATGAAAGTVSITGSVAVNGSPVALSGTGIAVVKTAALTPASWTISQTRNCPGTGFGAIACSADPLQVLILTNTGNVPLTGITQGMLGGTAANVANYSVFRLFSTCGPAGNGQMMGSTTLAAGASCAVLVQFKPLTTQAAGSKPATISVTDSVGTQTAALNGNAR